MLTDFDDPVALGISLDVHDIHLANDIKNFLVGLAVDMGMSGVICTNSASEPPRNQGETVNCISLYTPPVSRQPHLVESDLKRVVNMVSGCVSENKYVMYVTDSYKSADFYRINKCFRLAERSDFTGDLYFFGFPPSDIPDSIDEGEYRYFDSVQEFGDQVRAIVLGENG